jgi:Tfp pilus assembly protein PilF
VGEALSILAGITQKKGRNAEAESMYRTAVTLMEKQPPGEDLAYALRGLARLQARKKDFQAAQETYTRCLQMWEVLGLRQKHPVVQVRCGYGLVLGLLTS